MRPVTRFTSLAFELNHLLDSSLSTDLTETKRRIEDRTVLDWLSEKYSSKFHFDISLHSTEDRGELLDFFNANLECYNERRKMGVENNGLCLLLGYCIEGAQQCSQV